MCEAVRERRPAKDVRAGDGLNLAARVVVRRLIMAAACRSIAVLGDFALVGMLMLLEAVIIIGKRDDSARLPIIVHIVPYA
jgi:hypothetical protein